MGLPKPAVADVGSTGEPQDEPVTDDVDRVVCMHGVDEVLITDAVGNAHYVCDVPMKDDEETTSDGLNSAHDVRGEPDTDEKDSTHDITGKLVIVYAGWTFEVGASIIDAEKCSHIVQGMTATKDEELVDDEPDLMVTDDVVPL